MLQRAFSGAIILAILFALLALGGTVLLAGLLVFSGIGLYEYSKAQKSGGHKPYFRIMEAGGLVYYVQLFFFGGTEQESLFSLLCILLVWLALMIASVVKFPERKFTDAAVSMAGFVYVAVLFSFLYLLRIRQDGLFMVWYAVIASWGCDTFAYLTGRAFGKHKLVPKLSPKKTVEGAVGGVAGAVLLGVVYAFCIRTHVQMPFPALMTMAVVMCLAGAVLSQFGDLFASSLKREVDIKDYGHLIPGHGGILDRFDSTLLVAPVLYLVFTLVSLAL